jgi:transcriptional/translational regulatory protein YebC/TACO1
VRLALEKAGVTIESADQAMLAKQTTSVDVAKARQNLRLVEHLEDLEDVQRVTSNLEISEELLAEVAG